LQIDELFLIACKLCYRLALASSKEWLLLLLELLINDSLLAVSAAAQHNNHIKLGKSIKSIISVSRSLRLYDAPARMNANLDACNYAV